MKEADLTTLNGNEFCKMYDNTDWDKQICAGDLKNASDACKEDSGGPLFFIGSSRIFLAGIVSYGPLGSCGLKELVIFFVIYK